VDTSVFHFGLIRMLVLEEFKKRNIPWEQFIVSADMNLDIASTPRSKMKIPLPSTSDARAGTSKKRKRKAISQDKEVIKEVEETKREAYHSPQRDFSPPPTPELEEVLSSTKATTNKGRKLHFSSPSPAASIRINIPFTRSSSLNEAVEAHVLPKVSILKKFKDKGKGIEKPIEVINRAPVKQKYEGEAMKNLVEVINLNTPPSNHIFKILIRQLREARKEVACLKAEGLEDKRKTKELMDNYNNTLDLSKFTARRALPLHKKINNLYRLNKGFHSQNRKLKE
jgi:hypothetical protein